MDIPSGIDLSKTANAQYRLTEDFRVRNDVAVTYTPGSACKMVARDLQQFTDYRTVGLTAAVASDVLLAGIVSEDWKGFDGNNNFTSASSATARGTQVVKLNIMGAHRAALVDNSSGTSVTLVNGTPMHSSTVTPGRLQGVAASVAGAFMGNALLPSTGIGSSFGAGALVAASQTFTVAGAPAAGDVLTTTLQVPYLDSLLGIAQTRAVAYTLKSADAASVSAAAAATVVALNADAVFAKYYLATSSLGVITIRPVSTAIFHINWLNGDTMDINLAGTIGNSLTCSASAVGGSTYTAGGATFAGGTGYFGQVPIWMPVL